MIEKFDRDTPSGSLTEGDPQTQTQREKAKCEALGVEQRKFLKGAIATAVAPMCWPGRAAVGDFPQGKSAGRGDQNMLNETALGSRLVSFAGGQTGEWEVIRIAPVRGESLPPVSRIARISGSTRSTPETGLWVLRGVISNLRYVERTEKEQLTAKQEGLGRKEATLAALIPIKKSPAWWDLTQDERRRIFEAQSHHTEEGLKYLPAIARQLLHSRDLGEPFDFLTWFEYSPKHSDEFERLVHYLRGTEEWKYVEREVDIRLRRA